MLAPMGGDVCIGLVVALGFCWWWVGVVVNSMFNDVCKGCSHGKVVLVGGYMELFLLLGKGGGLAITEQQMYICRGWWPIGILASMVLNSWEFGSERVLVLVEKNGNLGDHPWVYKNCPWPLKKAILFRVPLVFVTHISWFPIELDQLQDEATPQVVTLVVTLETSRSFLLCNYIHHLNK